MSKRFVAPGNTIPVTAPSGGLVADQGYLIDGTRFSVIQGDAAEGEVTQAWIGRCICWLPKKAATAMTKGEPAYWDDDAAPAEIDNATATAHVLIGTIAADALAADTYVQVAVDGVHREAVPA